MTRSKEVAHIVIVIAMLIGIAHEKTYRATRSLALKHPRQYFDLVSLAPRRSETTLTRATASQLCLYKIKVHINARRHAVTWKNTTR